MRKFGAWLESSKNYAVSFGFFPAFANGVELDVVDAYTAFQRPMELNILRTLMSLFWIAVRSYDCFRRLHGSSVIRDTMEERVFCIIMGFGFSVVH